jgi:hypothetical protein
MAEDYQFRDALAARINRYRHAEQAAQERLDEIHAEVMRLRARREAAEALYEAEFGGSHLPGATPIESVVRQRPAVAFDASRSADQQLRTPGPLTGLRWEVAIEQVLRDAGEPLHVRDIWARLAEGGFRTNTADPERSVTAIAVRSARLVRSGRNTYALVSADDEKEAPR